MEGVFLVTKKSGVVENFDADKILSAIRKSAARARKPLTDQEECKVIAKCEEELLVAGNYNIPVEDIHNVVIEKLAEVRPDVSKTYREYHDFKKKELREQERCDAECNSIQWGLEKSNSNADSALCSTKRVKKYEVGEKSRYRRYFLSQAELQAVDDGYIYVHDMASRQDTMNCCLFNVAEVLKDGFEMNGIWYNEPKTLDVAFDVIGDIVLSAASQQYGGFTMPEVDSLLEPYAEKSYEKYLNKYLKIGVDAKTAEQTAHEDVLRDFDQGFQGWEYKFNTVASSRGDYPFISATFGLCTGKWGAKAAISILNTRRKGQGKEGHKKPVLFPKLIFLYDKNLHGEGCPLHDVFLAGVECSAKTMYPDWLSLTGKGYISNIYKQYGKAISPMGCRAFLSPWYEKGGMNPADENDTPVFIGRFNVGAISLNLPMILAKARKENRDFYDVLDYYLEMIRQLHIRTYEYLGQMKASVNPLGFCYGGFLGGNLDFNDKIEPVLKSATASFGITALNELQRLYNGKSLYEEGTAYMKRTGITESMEVKDSFNDPSYAEKGYSFEIDQYGFIMRAESGFFALDVLAYINKKIEQFKREDGNLYAIYGTPAESLCGLQIKQFISKYGVVKNVSDKLYVSNSFHCHVSENISPIEKQNVEYLFWELANGGKIQYVRYPLNYNKGAMKTLILRAMDMGFYEGVNLSLAYCDDCGHEELEMDVCPKCGSKNLTKIDRMNGYLSYSRVHGDTRLSDAKMAEIKDRISM